MKREFINDLYYGRLRPFERKVWKCPERTAVNQKIEEERRYFISKMSLDDCERFQALENLYGQSSGYENVDAFAYGLQFGALFMDAILAVDEKKS